MKDYHLPLGKLGKLSAGGWLILQDYADGKFPPTFADQAAAYAAEVEFYSSMSGSSREENVRAHRAKPFWGAKAFGFYSHHFTRLLATFEALGFRADEHLLELGCGAGWMAEFLTLNGYRVTGTTITPDDVQLGEERGRACVARGLPPGRLNFRLAPMETVHEAVADLVPVDHVFVFEALHHAYNWQAAIHSAARCLRPGGWLVLANEPNLSHTFVSYRVGRLTNTHEIGMSGPALRAEMRSAGLIEQRTLAPRFDNKITPHWIAGRKPLA
jgi:cyclopropane fatty-acyl-phospholipid synthase-like methyltransferase